MRSFCNYVLSYTRLIDWLVEKLLMSAAAAASIPTASSSSSSSSSSVDQSCRVVRIPESSSDSASPFESVDHLSCAWCRSSQTHPLFLYLLVDKRIDFERISNRRQFYIGLSSQPLVHIHCQNRIRGYRAGTKVTKHVAPHWELQLIVQVFEKGKQHKLNCRVAQSASFLCIYFIKLAEAFSLPLFAKYPSRLLKYYYYTQSTAAE